MIAMTIRPGAVTLMARVICLPLRADDRSAGRNDDKEECGPGFRSGFEPGFEPLR
jgi:hypothetical protein